MIETVGSEAGRGHSIDRIGPLAPSRVETIAPSTPRRFNSSLTAAEPVLKRVARIADGFVSPNTTADKIDEMVQKIHRYRNAVPDAYRNADRLLGRLLAGLAEDDAVLLVSDHGFEAADAKHVSSGTHGSSDASNDGIYIAAGGPISARHCPPEISLYDVAPTALYLLGVGIPEHMQGEVPPALFESAYLAATAVERSEAIAASTRREQAAPAEAIEAERLERLRVLGYLEEDE